MVTFHRMCLPEHVKELKRAVSCDGSLSAAKLTRQEKERQWQGAQWELVRWVEDLTLAVKITRQEEVTARSFLEAEEENKPSW